MRKCYKRVKHFPYTDIRRINKTKTYVVWKVILGLRQMPHSGGSKVIFLYPFMYQGFRWAIEKRQQQMLFPWGFRSTLGHRLPQLGGTQTVWQNSKLGIGTSVVFILMCTQAWGPQASWERFFTLPPLSSESPIYFLWQFAQIVKIPCNYRCIWKPNMIYIRQAQSSLRYVGVCMCVYVCMLVMTFCGSRVDIGP